MSQVIVNILKVLWFFLFNFVFCSFLFITITLTIIIISFSIINKVCECVEYEKMFPKNL